MKALCNPNTDGFCTQCLESIPTDVRKTCPAWLKQNVPIQKVGLGTRVAHFLAYFGAKKDGCGGCGRREEKLNRFGWLILAILSLIFKRITKKPKRASTKEERAKAFATKTYTPSPEKIARQQAILDAQKRKLT